MLKRFSSIALAVALVLAMSVTAFAAGDVTTIESGVFVSSIEYTSGDEYDVGSPISEIYEDFSPGDAINIYLDPSKFSGATVEFTPETGMSAKDLKNAGVDFRVSGGKNSNLIKNVSFKEKTLNDKKVAVIQVQLVDNVVSTEDKEFETTLTIYANKVKQQSIVVAGTIGSGSVEVNSSDSFIYLGGGDVAEATESINSIEVDAGNNVTLTARMHQGKKYYAVAQMNPTSYDMEVMDEYPEIELVYQLDTKGFLESDVSVKIDIDEKLYVYNAEGKYVGTTKDSLPLSGKYYLAKEEIEMSITGDPDSGDDGDLIEPGLPEPEPGDTVAPGGSGSDIPDTGVGIAPKIATMAVVVGLGTILIVALTSRKKD